MEEKIGMELEVTVMVLAILRKQVTHLLLNSGQLLPKEMHLYIVMLAIIIAGIDVQTQKKTEKTVQEINLDINLNLALSSLI